MHGRLHVNGTHVWTRQYGSPQSESINDMACTPGAVVMVGMGQAPMILGSLPQPAYVGGTSDAWVAKYSSELPPRLTTLRD